MVRLDLERWIFSSMLARLLPFFVNGQKKINPEGTGS
jgi:hypothetical protein